MKEGGGGREEVRGGLKRFEGTEGLDGRWQVILEEEVVSRDRAN